MIKQIEALYQANPGASLEEIAKTLKAQTGLTIRECREWVKAWVLA